MGITQLNFAGLNRIEVAIKRLQSFEPPMDGYYLAFSGGKDSIVVYDLAVKAGVKFDAHYSIVGIDPPEQMLFVRNNYPSVIWDKPRRTFWQEFITNGFPTRQFRWCCKLIKEPAGTQRRVVTGIRWQESGSRKKRRMFEVCNQDKTKYYLNPIIDWTEQDVWEYIRQESIPYCSLYDEMGADGKPLFKRLGCVLCPMATNKCALRDIKRFPKTALAWRKVFERYWQDSFAKGKSAGKRWANSEDMWQWWLTRKGEPKVDDAQCIMFDN